MTESSQGVIIDTARMLSGDDIIERIVGAGHNIIGNNVCYHKPCMDLFRAKWLPANVPSKQVHVGACDMLVERSHSKFLLDKEKDTLSEQG